MSETLTSDGLHSVIATPGETWPYWIAVRTHNRKPVDGQQGVRRRGAKTLEEAVRIMQRMTRSLIAGDPSLKRFTDSHKASPAESTPEADMATGRGRQAGSKNRVRPKQGRPALTGPKRVPFFATRFHLMGPADGTNPVAQVWRCFANDSKPRGRRAAHAVRRTIYPHTIGDYMVVLHDRDVVCDDDGHPVVYPPAAAMADAHHFYAIEEGDKLPRDGIVHYRVAFFEAHFTFNPTLSNQHYTIFNTRAGCYLNDGQHHEPIRYERLSGAKAAVDRLGESETGKLARILTVASAAIIEAEEYDRATAADRQRREMQEAARAAAEFEAEQQRLRELSANKEEREPGVSRARYIERMRESDPDWSPPVVRRMTEEEKRQFRRAKYERGTYHQPDEDEE